MTRVLTINSTIITDDSDAYAIAEIGNNGQGSVEITKRLIRAAAEAGFSAVKIQKRTNRVLFTKAAYEKPYNSEHAYGATYGAHREALEFDWEQYTELQAYATDRQLDFFATAFDPHAADFLAKLEVPAIKMASGDITNTPLLSYVASLQIPMIVSTGTANMDDVERAALTIVRHHQNFALLQCTAFYPCPAELINLRVIETYRQRFPGTVIGLSTHFNGILMAPLAYALGARVIEQHVTLDRTAKGSDHAMSLEPVGQRKLIRDLKRARLALGDGVKRFYPEEAGAIKKMAKSTVAAFGLDAGTTIARHHLEFKTPGGNLPPWRYPELIGKVLKRDVSADEPITLEMVE